MLHTIPPHKKMLYYQKKKRTKRTKDITNIKFQLDFPGTIFFIIFNGHLLDISESQFSNNFSHIKEIIAKIMIKINKIPFLKSNEYHFLSESN